MKKRFLTLILAIMSLAMLRPLPVNATTPPESYAEASLTLHYQKDETAFTDLSIGIYRIAEVLPSGSYQLIDPYASYPIYIHSITSQEQWQHIAQTLYSYIVAYDNTLIIGGIDSPQQFGFCKEIELGAYVAITDMTGHRFTYTVSKMERSDHAETSWLTDDESALTLFCHDIYAMEYIAVRCNLASGS